MVNLVGHHQIDTAYRLINLTGGRIDPNHSNVSLRLNQDDTTFCLTRADNNSVTHVTNVDSPDDLAPLVDPGVRELVSKIDLVGGDVVLRQSRSAAKAWPRASRAPHARRRAARGPSVATTDRMHAHRPVAFALSPQRAA